MVNILSVVAQAPLFQWANRLGGSGDDHANSIAVDDNGNSFVTGGPSRGFLSKFDASGKLAWTKHLGGELYSTGWEVTLDKIGNIYVTGFFTGKMDFDPDSTTVFELTSNGSADVFIIKLNNTGELLWVKQIGGVNNDAGFSVSVDDSGNVLTTGKFGGTVDFNPGTATYNLTTFGTAGIFISKLDKNGDFIWAAGIGGSSNDYGSDIAIDKFGNIYTTGIFADTADFDPGVGKYNLIAGNYKSTFILKLNKDGNFMWAKSIESNENSIPASIAIDLLNNVFLCGTFKGQVDFDPGSGVSNLYSSDGSFDIFIMKLFNNGNFSWVKNIAGTNDDYGNYIVTDRNNSIYITGKFAGIVNIDSLGWDIKLSSYGNDDVLILKIDKFGDFEWVKQIGGSYTDVGNALAVDMNNNVYVTGGFLRTADFDPGSPIFNLDAIDEMDIFVLKLGFPSSEVNVISTFDSFMVYPNPTNGVFYIALQDNEEWVNIEVYSSTGVLVWSEVGNFQVNTLNLTDCSKGLYVVQVRYGNGLIKSQKIILE